MSFPLRRCAGASLAAADRVSVSALMRRLRRGSCCGSNSSESSDVGGWNVAAVRWRGDVEADLDGPLECILGERQCGVLGAVEAIERDELDADAEESREEDMARPLSSGGRSERCLRLGWKTASQHDARRETR